MADPDIAIRELMKMIQEAESDKFCKDCKWADYGPEKDIHPISTVCLHPSATVGKVSLVTGKAYPTTLSCLDQRWCLATPSGFCGIEGQYWEPREDT